MSHQYQAVLWNRQKRKYDQALLGGVALFLILFGAATKALFPTVTDEIMLIRAFGAAAFTLLTIILCIGPLCRLNPMFLPLLYNRRHMGVTLFVLGFIHFFLVLATYHIGGDINPILSIFVSEGAVGGTGWIPFQPFGFIALVILFLMAATSHDFWLSNLSAPVWKALHMLVYVAYASLIAHVAFGILQTEKSPVYLALTGGAIALVATLHLLAAIKTAGQERLPGPEEEGFVEACGVEEIPENRACIVTIAGERVAVFKYEGKISAVSNVCQHQNGPLGEGKFVDGCITCPWHGYQYWPDSGASPPPFTEKIPTFRVRIADGKVYVDPQPQPPGTKVEPALIPA